MLRRLTQPLSILLLALCIAPCFAINFIPDDYDNEFEDAAIFLPASIDGPRLLKAQCYQESRLNPLAISPVGAQGLCQFMPNTWADMQRHHPELLNPYSPEQSILASALYMAKLNNGWWSERPAIDRWMLSLASYNAGAGNLHKAQKLCGNPNLYADIVQCLPKVTHHHSRETIGYVKNIIGKWWPLLLLDS